MNHANWDGSSVFIANYKHIQGINLLIPFVTLSMLLSTEKSDFKKVQFLAKRRQSSRGNAAS